MSLLRALDAISAVRGDGLRPELRELIDRTAATPLSDKVTELAHYRDTGFRQAGPNPVNAAHRAGEKIVTLHPTRPADAAKNS